MSSLHQIDETKVKPFLTEVLGEGKRGQATADYDSTSRDELSLMSYEVCVQEYKY